MPTRPGVESGEPGVEATRQQPRGPFPFPHTAARPGRRQWVDGVGRSRAGGHVLAHAAGAAPGDERSGPKPGAQNRPPLCRGLPEPVASRDGARATAARCQPRDRTTDRWARRPCARFVMGLEPGSVPGPERAEAESARVGSVARQPERALCRWCLRQVTPAGPSSLPDVIVWPHRTDGLAIERPPTATAPARKATSSRASRRATPCA